MTAQELVQKHKLLECIHCGICTGSCPVARKANLNVRKYMREIAVSGKLTIHPQNELWSCTTCATCGVRCPKEINPYDFLIDIRSLAVEQGQIATTLRDALESIFKNGNPWVRIRSKRSEWAQDLNIKHVSQGVEFLYFVGCTPAYDPRVQDVAKSLVKCFEKAGVNFGTLGNEENCCGNEVYGMGEKGLFEFLVEENIKIFNKYDVKQVVTDCPHAYHSFKNRYGQTSFEVMHYTQLLADLINKGKLTFSGELNKTVIYHDPCFIGKQNGIYDEPRKVIESIPGVNLVEFDRSRERSLCCEGGGGRMWIDIPGERLAETRIKDAIETGAEILATACPFCLLTFEDAVKTTGLEGKIQVLDIAELLSRAI
ncbi:MAG: (Fe-S)-binding protein [Candidatus Bathyarchaeota archaeon]|nr:(Fe-S)-binding protein [Candidatus Bathyarchaeota archaeon]MDH5494434.1 (Fe-S)-binding protein [Candidatus Bathyarchaeota archaeon]